MYLDINHPEIIPFLEMRKATGDHNIRCQNLHHGINITDKFMELIEKCVSSGTEFNDSWDLIDPHTKLVKSTVSARELWQRILQSRLKTGEPYLCFIDRCNRMMPSFQKDKGLKITQSNLCSEIILPTDENRTAVCCLASLNLEKYYEWRDDTHFITDVAEMLDNALEIFIQRAPAEIHRAVYSATRERSIGIGTLGWHSLLQSLNISIESSEAESLNVEIFSRLKTEIDAANIDLGNRRGEAPDAAGTGRRFSSTMAIAPNATSSIIMGNTSPSIEPYRANAYRQDTLSGSYLNKNKHLDKLLASKNLENVNDVWHDIILHSGSVQHLDFLTIREKNVFKTAFEIDQNCLIKLASDRQKYIDQSQSLNLFLPPKIQISMLHKLHFDAWKMGIKTLYYCRSTKIADADKLQTIQKTFQTTETRNEPKIACSLKKSNQESCRACE